MWSSNLFFASSCFPRFSQSRFFRVQVFQGPGFSESRFFWVQVFQSPGFSGSGSRVRVQGLGPGFRSSRQDVSLKLFLVALGRSTVILQTKRYPNISKKVFDIKVGSKLGISCYLTTYQQKFIQNNTISIQVEEFYFKMLSL